MDYDVKNHDFENPDPWTALALDDSTFIRQNVKEALLRNNASKSRQFLLPVIRPLARLSIVLFQVVRLVLPRALASSNALHATIVWGMRNFVNPEANYLILRHFNIGTQILRFIGDNIDGLKVQGHPLEPQKIEDLRDNVFVQHDLNIYNFITQVGAHLQKTGQDVEHIPLEKLDFSAIEDVDSKIAEMPDRWHNILDLQSAIEFYTPMFAALLTDDDFWRASNSLQLDETIAVYVTKMFDKEIALAMVNNRHPMVPLSTMEAGFRLMLHGLDAENLYGFICDMKEKQEALKKAKPAPKKKAPAKKAAGKTTKKKKSAAG